MGVWKQEGAKIARQQPHWTKCALSVPQTSQQGELVLMYCETPGSIVEAVASNKLGSWVHATWIASFECRISAIYFRQRKDLDFQPRRQIKHSQHPTKVCLGLWKMRGKIWAKGTKCWILSIGSEFRVFDSGCSAFCFSPALLFRTNLKSSSWVQSYVSAPLCNSAFRSKAGAVALESNEKK